MKTRKNLEWWMTRVNGYYPSASSTSLRVWILFSSAASICGWGTWASRSFIFPAVKGSLQSQHNLRARVCSLCFLHSMGSVVHTSGRLGLHILTIILLLVLSPSSSGPMGIHAGETENVNYTELLLDAW